MSAAPCEEVSPTKEARALGPLVGRGDAFQEGKKDEAAGTRLGGIGERDEVA